MIIHLGLSFQTFSFPSLFVAFFPPSSFPRHMLRVEYGRLRLLQIAHAELSLDEAPMMCGGCYSDRHMWR